MSESGEWPTLRRLHLLGGLRIEELEEGKARIYPLEGNAARTFDVSSYASIGKDVSRCTGIRVVGCEFIRSREELEGLSQPEWRPIIPRLKNEWPSHTAELNWSGLANAAREKRDSRLFLIAGSIKSQLRFSSMRLLDLSERYLRTLRSLVRRENKVEEGCGYRGSLDVALFTSIHAAFFEMATLRDYIGEYIAYAVYSNEQVDNFRDLYNKLILKDGIRNTLQNEIAEIYGEGGWLKAFSDRRNTLAHRMPFDRTGGGVLALYVKHHALPLGGSAWLLHVPAPKPIPIKYKSTFSLPEDEDRMTEEMWDEVQASRNREDTLMYLFDTFERIVGIANNLSGTFPYPPKMVAITDDDIVTCDS